MNISQIEKIEHAYKVLGGAELKGIDDITDRDIVMIMASMSYAYNYADAGMPSHNLMVLIAKLVHLWYVERNTTKEAAPEEWVELRRRLDSIVGDIRVQMKNEHDKVFQPATVTETPLQKAVKGKYGRK